MNDEKRYGRGLASILRNLETGTATPGDAKRLRVGDLVDLARGLEASPGDLLEQAKGAYEAAVLLRSWPDPRRAFA